MQKYIFEITRDDQYNLDIDKSNKRNETHYGLIKESQRKDAINLLESLLPKKMFLREGNKFIYMGGYKEWLNNYFLTISENAKKFMSCNGILLVKSSILNYLVNYPFKTNDNDTIDFFLSEVGNDLCGQILFMQYVSAMKKGETIYVNSILH